VSLGFRWLDREHFVGLRARGDGRHELADRRAILAMCSWAHDAMKTGSVIPPLTDGDAAARFGAATRCSPSIFIVPLP
jgi:hypothetical protein